jgi:hypothetical protein
MPRLTLQQQLVRGLDRLGFVRSRNRVSRKYVVFDDHRMPALATGTPGVRYLYVGKAGALRRGSTIALSVPDDRLKLAALNAGLPEAVL